MIDRPNAQAIVTALRGRWMKDHGVCHCPGHDDITASLSVTESPEGKVLVYCHAGCSQAAVIDALRSQGLWPNGAREERQPPRAKARKAKAAKGSGLAVVATRIFPYEDEARVILFETVRKELADGSKLIFQRRIDARGRTVHNLEGVRLVLYRLPELIAAIDAGQTIYIVEGEPKVSLLTTWGLVATCNPMGAGKWKPAFAQFFKVRRVPIVILPDNDEPGRRHAQMIAENLAPWAESIKVIELPRLGPGEDVVDWARDRGDKHMLFALVDAMPPWEPAADPAQQPEPAAEKQEPEPPDPDAEPAPPREKDEGGGGIAAPAWRRRLICSEEGHAKPLLANAMTAFRLAPEWQGVLSFDEFALKVVVRRAVPWQMDFAADQAWTSTDDVLAANWLQHRGVMVSPLVAGQAIDAVARDHPFHPVRDHLDRLHWDGQPRLETWAVRYLGARNAPYVRAVAARWMISAVARIYRPGCKADHCLMLEGLQGILKSTALKTLGDPWFTDEVAELGTKDASLQLLGVWIIELAELDSMRRPEVSRVKAFLARTTDRFRPPYGRRVIEAPRQCVFAGTVNLGEYLRDQTGGRRFWPIECGRIDVEGLAAERDQLWAEARARFLAGETWWLDTGDLEAAARDEQEARREVDPWEDAVADYVADKATTSVAAILAHLGRRPAEMTQVDQNRVARCLKLLGWRRFKVGAGAERGTWAYRRTEGPTTPGEGWEH